MVVPGPASDPAADRGAQGSSSWAPPRRGSRRERRGRGLRGPATLPGPLTPEGAPERPSRRHRFDAVVLEVMDALEQRWSEELAELELAVEETPVLPPQWPGDTVPLASVVRGEQGLRLVVFRRPIELRASADSELAALVLTVVVEQISELLGRPPHEIDPRYGD